MFVWQRYFAVSPPALDAGDLRFPGHDLRYAALAKTELPHTESVKDVRARVLPYWHGTLVSEIQQGRHILIVAHGNSLRALTTYLDDIADADIPKVKRPMTGEPLIYELDENVKPLRHYYLRQTPKLRQWAKSIFG